MVIHIVKPIPTKESGPSRITIAVGKKLRLQPKDERNTKAYTQ
jgi:hypothetical protein